MNAIRKARSSGFTLIEALVAVSVLLVLVSLAVPGMRTWMQNAQIRNAAESIQDGLQRARSEAVLQNTNVEFVLGGTDDIACLPASCSSWMVKFAGVGGAQIASQTNVGSAEVKRTTVLSATAPASKTTVTFNNVGNRVINADGSNPFASVTFDSSALSAGVGRKLTIVIGVKNAAGNYVGGTVRMCDPTFPSSDPRGC